MKKLLLLGILITSIFCFSQKITDSSNIIIGGYNVKAPFVTFYSDKCSTVGEYTKDRNEDDIFYPAAIYKCVKNDAEIYIVKSFYCGDEIYFQVMPGRLMLINDEQASFLDFYDFYNLLNIEEKSKLENLSKSKSEEYIIYKKQLLLEEILDYKKYGIGILKSVPTDDYSMTGAKFEVFNASDKEIKYISFNFYGKNAVKDKVGVNMVRKGIGPIGSFETASYEFDAVWLTDIVQTLKLISVNIIYMNGTTKNITITDKHYMDPDLLYKYDLMHE